MATIDSIRRLLNDGKSYAEASATLDLGLPPAVASAPAVAAPTKAEYDALRDDLIALRTFVVSVVAALESNGTVL